MDEKDVLNWISNVGDVYLHALLNRIFDMDNILKDFLVWPAASRNHHARQGGLFKHTKEVVEVVQVFCNLYSALDRDLAITIAVLHDIGKLYTYTGPIDLRYTLQGRLIGHLSISKSIVEEAIQTIPDFPARLKIKILHGILAHHGKLEQGSPVAPMIPEAVLVYYADHLSAAVVSTLEAVKEKKELTHSKSRLSSPDFNIFTERNIFTGTKLYCG